LSKIENTIYKKSKKENWFFIGEYYFHIVCICKYLSKYLVAKFLYNKKDIKILLNTAKVLKQIKSLKKLKLNKKKNRNVRFSVKFQRSYNKI